VLIKTLLYTGVRVSELVAIRLDDVDFDRCQMRVNEGKGRKDGVVPFPPAFKETLALHADRLRREGATHLFESSWKKPFSDRGVRRLLERYATAAGLAHPISPHRLRHFLLTWLKNQRIDDGSSSHTRSRQPQVLGDLIPASDRRGATGVRHGHAAVPRLAAPAATLHLVARTLIPPREGLLPPWARRSPKVAEALRVYLRGIPTKDFEPALARRKPE
jgi:hypothetical protein